MASTMMIKSILILCLFLTTSAIAQQLSNEEREILTLQDQRSLGDGKLVSFLKHADEGLRYHAARALANIQDSSTVGALLPLLKDSIPRVRAAAAFALGQLGTGYAQDSLLNALWAETDPGVVGRIAEALGRCGNEDAELSMVEHAATPAIEAARDQFVLGIARFALRPAPIKANRAIWYCFDQLNQQNASVRWAALYGLWRLAPLRVIDIEIARRFEDLMKLLTDPSPDVRMALASLLGKSKSSESVSLLKQLFVSEKKANDWRVQVVIARSLGAQLPTSPGLIPEFLSGLQSPNEHVVIVTSQIVATLAPTFFSDKSTKKNLETDLVRLSSSKDKSDMVHGEALVALGRHFPTRVPGNLLMSPKTSLRLKSKVLEALSFSQTREVFKIFLRHLADDSVRVSMAAWDFFRRIASPFTINEFATVDTSLRNVRQMLYAAIKKSLEKRDMAVTTLTSNALADMVFFSIFWKTEFEDKVREALVDAYQHLASPGDTEAMQSVLVALEKIGNQTTVPVLDKALHDPDRTVAVLAASALSSITHKDYSGQVAAATKALHTDYDWQTLESMPADQRVSIKTSKGTITLQLMKEHAPFTVLSMVRLIQRGMFNGLSFHRVVPNFVIQGGDPRGDGWGGPGYAIRSEYSLVNYQRGMVGVASSGKDTEGCQFFVVHSSQPNLDGRYTIFAKVIDGMTVVDTIQVGDKIVSMELVK
jgi:peptidylprolyl isomerase